MTDNQKTNPTPGSGKYADTGSIGYRPYWVLLLSVILRAVHQVGAAVYLASFLIEGLNGPPQAYLLLALISGIALLFTEGMRHRQIYREVSGLGTFVKVILLGLAYHQLLPVLPTVLAAFLLASLCAHFPKEIRHRLIF
jgi:hypothetical protein